MSNKYIKKILIVLVAFMSNSFATPWTVAHQAPLSVGFPRQEYWSGVPFPSPMDLPNPGIEFESAALACGFFTIEPPREAIYKRQMRINVHVCAIVGFPGGSDGKESACNAGDLDLIPGLGRSPGGGHGNPLWYSCLENSMDRGAWRATVHGVAQSRTWLNN